MATDKLTILMIDDDADAIATVRTLLDRVPVWSVELIGCPRAEDAPHQVVQRQPHLVLLEFRYASISGPHLLSALRAAGCGGPFVLLSDCGPEDLAAMVRAGLSDFLAKRALSSLTLYHAITLALEKQRLRLKSTGPGGTKPETAPPGLDPVRATRSL